MEWCRSRIAVRCAKAIYFWQLAAADPRILHRRRSIREISLRMHLFDSYTRHYYPRCHSFATFLFFPFFVPLIAMDFFVFVIAASGVSRRAIPPCDDSPEPSSILLYIPYVTFTMGSKEARNGRPVIELNSSEFRSAPWARSILFYSPRLQVRRHPTDVRTISRYLGTCPCHNLVSRMRLRYVIRRASERSWNALQRRIWNTLLAHQGR